MTWLRIALLPAMLYLLADFASPHVAGALSFEADGCIDGVRTERPRASTERTVVAPDRASRSLERPVSEKRPDRGTDAGDSPGSRIALARDPRYAAADPAPSTDDH